MVERSDHITRWNLYSDRDALEVREGYEGEQPLNTEPEIMAKLFDGNGQEKQCLVNP